jgi:hypothetical protein
MHRRIEYPGCVDLPDIEAARMAALRLARVVLVILAELAFSLDSFNGFFSSPSSFCLCN